MEKVLVPQVGFSKENIQFNLIFPMSKSYGFLFHFLYL